ncbi:HIT family protein [Candidatus Woesearchaeota archaeon]|nr:HIT family protein [Candidatus Woesearchaeota archaeon]
MVEECLFCKIVKGELPSSKIYEDENTLAFLDLFPVNKGHSLVISKEHYENIFDVPEEILSKISSVVKKVASAVKKGVNADGISIIQSNGKSAGQVIPHIHFHVMPRFKEDGLKLWPQGKYDENEMEEYKNTILKFL